jgi:magnesium chelatase family protein
MAVATARSVSLHGALGHLIDVQADVSPGQAGFTMVGRPDLSLREAGDRCRMAIINSDLGWPATKRITILLSPADLIKRGPHFDLAVAVAVLAADDAVPAGSLADTAFIGELTLEGGLRSVAGVLPMVLAAAERGIHHVFVPEPQAREAAMVPGMAVFGMRSLQQVVAELRGEVVPAAPPVAPMSGSRLLTWRGEERLEQVDLADLDGMADAKYAVTVAAAGGHAVLLSGPKGAGKTSLAERIPTILPPLVPEEALELTAIHSLAGALEPGDDLITTPPYSAPHHDASKTSIVGGGSGQVRPGEISRSHAGVLFLDEFPLFRSDIIEALRQPLESGDITVARRDESVTLPARGMLVLACNPCPCGNYAVKVGRSQCTCRSQQLRDYRAKLGGPLADRVDITRHVGPVQPHERGGPPAEPSAAVRDRVGAARRRQHERYADCGWRLNAHVPGSVLRDRWPLAPDAKRVIDSALYDGHLSSRGAVRVHRLALTVADLASVTLGREVGVGPEEVDTALRLRQGDPILLDRIASAAG